MLLQGLKDLQTGLRLIIANTLRHTQTAVAIQQDRNPESAALIHFWTAFFASVGHLGP